METRKVNSYACCFIETIWKMMQFYNYVLFAPDRSGVYRTIEFIKASDKLYYCRPLAFKDRNAIYKYMRLKLATNFKINPVQYVLYIIKAWFEIMFTNKPTKIARDIIGFANTHVFSEYFSESMSITQKIKSLFGFTKEDLGNDMNMYIYMEARGYDVKYG